MRRPRRVWIPSLILVAVIAAAILGFRCLGITDISHEQIDRLQDTIRSWGIWGYVLYVGISLVTCLALGPATPLVLIAGVYGPVTGTLLSSLTLTLCAVCAFLLARHTFRPFLHDKIGHLPSFRKIDKGVARDGWHMLLITRLVPAIPFSLQNYLYGLTRIRIGIYALITWLCLLPPCVAYAMIGSSLIEGKGDFKKMLAYIVIGGIVLAALSLIPRIIIRRMRISLPEDNPIDSDTSNGS